jgi:hypothetical protein
VVLCGAWERRPERFDKRRGSLAAFNESLVCYLVWLLEIFGLCLVMSRRSVWFCQQTIKCTKYSVLRFLIFILAHLMILYFVKLHGWNKNQWNTPPRVRQSNTASLLVSSFTLHAVNSSVVRLSVNSLSLHAVSNITARLWVRLPYMRSLAAPLDYLWVRCSSHVIILCFTRCLSEWFRTTRSLAALCPLKSRISTISQ